MAENEIYVEASPQRVFAVLSDPQAYPRWVGGAKDAHDDDPRFPEPGSSFEYEVGVGPLTLHDRTEVVDSDPPHRLVLRANLRDVGAFLIHLDLRPERTGTRIEMREEPEGGGVLVDNPVTDAAIRLRNAYSLEKLKALAEAR
jgi:uncharacterized protein YndB with AHSA1/START domain